MARLGSSAVRVECYSPERIAPMREEAAQQLDTALAAARQAVREGRRVEWTSPNGGADDVESIVSRVTSREAPDRVSRPLAVTTVTQLVYFFRCPLVYYFSLVLQLDENPRGRGKSGAYGTAPPDRARAWDARSRAARARRLRRPAGRRSRSAR